ncbi:MAG: HlyD family efflux transporter periplasmic adaptor subunit [Bryobacteraceae bacterium]
MQSQMSGASLPNPVPKPAPASPASEPAVKRPKSRGRWWALLFVLLAGGAAYWLRNSSADSSGGKSGPAVTRTATVTQSLLQKTIRLTGTTGAENFVSLVSPQLRGSRGGGGRDTGSKSYSSGSNPNLVITSNAGRGSSSASSTASSGGSDASGSGTVASSAGAAGSNQSAAMQASTSRVSKPGSGSSRPSTSSNSGSSDASGASPLGSTADQLNGGGGGGGGDFGLVLLHTMKPGSLAKKGEVVAEFDRQYMLNRLDDYLVSVSQTEASLTKLKAEMAVARNTHDQAIAAAKADFEKAKLDVKTIPVLGAIDAERVKLALEEAEAQYKQVLAEVKYFDIGQQAQYRNAELDLQQAKLELRRAQANADRMVMKAAIGGLVVMQNTIRGSEMAQIQEGDQLFPGQPFMQIVDTRSMVINASVSQVDVEHMRIGLKARVRFDAYPELELPAHVYAISAITKPGGSRANFVKEVPVRLKLDSIDPRIIPDLSVSVDVILESEEQATVTPLASVFPGENGKQPYVLVKTASGWEKREVELGISSFIAVAVKSGLKPGEVVALEVPVAEPPASKT